VCSCSENGTVDADLSDHIVMFIHHYHLLLSYYYSTSIVVVVVINVPVTLFSEIALIHLIRDVFYIP